VRKSRTKTKPAAKARPATKSRTAPATTPKPTITSAVPALLTIGEAAAAARVSKPTIVRAYGKGELRVFRTPLGGVVRIHADSLDAWIERNSFGGSR
jgi:excisionase family DNA binding protein